MPYRFYALSNFGSLLALLSYPILVEPSLGAAGQAYTWSGGVCGLPGAVRAGGVLGERGPVADGNRRTKHERYKPGGKRYAVWIGLAACPSALLLAITTHITQNIAPIPLLWVLPLSLYLLTLILCFESDRWYKRILWYKAFVFICAVLTYVLFPGFENTKVWILLPLFLRACLFAEWPAMASWPVSARPRAGSLRFT